jgi:hypothetical protein
VLAEEFEKHDGLRPLVIATGMHDQSPIDDLNHYFEVIDRRLGPEELMKGVQTDPDLYPLIEACLELRDRYGHAVWIEGALLDNLRFVKGLSYNEALRGRNSMYQNAIKRAGEKMLRNLLVNVDH